MLLSWDIADGHYLYRQKFKFAPLTQDVLFMEPAFPPGQSKHNDILGNVEIYRHHIDVELPILRQANVGPKPDTLSLKVTYQGCEDDGVCYMPIQKELALAWPAPAIGDTHKAAPPTPPIPTVPFLAEHDRIAALLTQGSLWLTALSFLGFGLLLAFTPCILPMIPIISGIIAGQGQGQGLTTGRAFGLSLGYVLASALTYTVFGIMAGLFGNNLQALFQTPWLIMVFSGIYVLLALSLFDIVNVQIPLSLQNKMAALSARQQGGRMLGVVAMGVFSTLAVGPCVTAPLAGILLYIGQSGDAILGGLALFALGLGMGIPLLIVGTSAGKLLPKAGAWMNATKTLFGFGLLAVAVWLLGRILTPSVTAWLWGLLALVPLLLFIHRKRWKGVAWSSPVYGVLLFLGVGNQHDDVSQLLCSAAAACEAPTVLAFEKIATTDAFQDKLGQAHANKQWVMLDIYADWCVSCQEMEQRTFADPRIREALANVMLLKADITQNSVADQMLLKQFNLIGPPAILFFAPDQQGQANYRMIGYVNTEQFLDTVSRLFKNPLTLSSGGHNGP